VTQNPSYGAIVHDLNQFHPHPNFTVCLPAVCVSNSYKDSFLSYKVPADSSGFDRESVS